MVVVVVMGGWGVGRVWVRRCGCGCAGDVRNYCDVTIVNPAALTHIARAQRSLGAAKFAAKKKINKYASRIQALKDQGNKVVFTPVAGEAYGGWCPQAIQFFTFLATKMAHRPGVLTSSDSQLLRDLLIDLDVVMQRVNAEALVRRDKVVATVA